MKLSTILPYEVVKQSKKLQGIECEKYFFRGKPMFLVDTRLKYEDSGFYPAPSLADVIDNAEELFGNKIISHIGIGRYCKAYVYVSNEILSMCQQDKPLEEISKYILDNIK